MDGGEYNSNEWMNEWTNERTNERTNEWMNEFYSADERIEMDMSYKKYKFNELQYIKLD